MGSWTAPCVDLHLNLVFVGTSVTSPAPKFRRDGIENTHLYHNSTLALDADTGEIVWYFQHIPNDEWDLDHPFARMVVETVVAPRADAVQWMNTSVTPGQPRKIVTGIPGKTGIVWALDAATGAFLWARPTNFQNVVVDIDAESRRVLLNPALKSPQVGEPVFVCPSLTGGINWQATAYHPGTNALYAPTNNTCNELTLNEFRLRPGAHHGSARVALAEAPDSDGQIGQFTAVDVGTGETLWVHRQRAGFGGSTLTTGGGLVFVTDGRPALPCLRCPDRRNTLGADSQLERGGISGVLHARRRAVCRHRRGRRGQLPRAHPGNPAAGPRQHAVRLQAALS